VVTEVVPGGTVTQRMVPVERVGLYVPGGLAPLVSSVVMNVVPAQVAGVSSIALTSSPQASNGGLPHPTILAACALLGVDEVYAVGGAQAVAMFAYGAGPCRPVDLVTGPGNIYTVSAKRLLKGVVGIDSEAGPTEIAILADDTPCPRTPSPT
jgi:histidinol dehydrogenase